MRPAVLCLVETFAALEGWDLARPPFLQAAIGSAPGILLGRAQEVRLELSPVMLLLRTRW